MGIFVSLLLFNMLIFSCYVFMILNNNVYFCEYTHNYMVK